MNASEKPKGGGAKALILASAMAAIGAVTVFTIDREGNELDSYRDIVGIWTVCGGVTGRDAGPGKSYTAAQCDEMNKRKVAEYLTGVAGCVNRPLTEGQWVALGSWAYNVGVPAACSSTLMRQLNAGQPAAVWCAQLLRWDYAGGKKVRGLTNRRKAEHKECVG